MGSGLLLTFIFNCIVLSLLFRCAFLKKYFDKLFRDYCALITGGDDSGMSTSLEDFDGPYIASVFSEYGYELTTARKNQDFVEKFTPWEEFVFLKRTPRYEPLLDYEVGCLDLDSILKNMAFVLPSKTQPLAEQLAQKADAAARELSLHPQDVFDKYIAVLKAHHSEIIFYTREYYLMKYYKDDLYEDVCYETLPVEGWISESDIQIFGDTIVTEQMVNQFDTIADFNFVMILLFLINYLYLFLVQNLPLDNPLRRDEYCILDLVVNLSFVYGLSFIRLLDYGVGNPHTYDFYISFNFIIRIILSACFQSWDQSKFLGFMYLMLLITAEDTNILFGTLLAVNWLDIYLDNHPLSLNLYFYAFGEFLFQVVFAYFIGTYYVRVLSILVMFAVRHELFIIQCMDMLVKLHREIY
jgi:hypothetical protein